MFGDSFLTFLREDEGKADRQKVMALSALVGSSVLAQVMFAGVAQADNHCNWSGLCFPANKESCEEMGCVPFCDGGVMTCHE